jgi:hypothetical protein
MQQQQQHIAVSLSFGGCGGVGGLRVTVAEARAVVGRGGMAATRAVAFGAAAPVEDGAEARKQVSQ